MIIDIQLYWGENDIFYPEILTAKIIAGMAADGTVTLFTYETRSALLNGGFELLTSLCNYMGWDKSKIILQTSSLTEKHNEFTVIPNGVNRSVQYINIPPSVPFDLTSNKRYGVFIGRATSSRIRAIHNHNNFAYKALGLASFNDDLVKSNKTKDVELARYLFETDQRYSDMIKVVAFSDIDTISAPPILPGRNDSIAIWSKVYSQISVEIVCETSCRYPSYSLSEKLFRCILYKRVFLIIGAPWYTSFLQSLGLRSFAPIIDESYDLLSGCARVDKIYEVLAELIESKRIDTILNDCRDIIEHNYAKAIEHKITQVNNYPRAKSD